MKAFKFFLLASVLLTNAAFAHEIKIGKLVIHHPYIRQPIGSAKVAGAYTKIDNTGTEDDTLIKATIDGVDSVEIHDMKMQGDVMKMSEMTEGLLIPAGKSVELKPKSSHFMISGMKSPFIENETVKGTFTFAKAGTVAVDFEVIAPDADAHVH